MESRSRQHLIMPTNSEALSNPSTIYSDHALLMGKIPLEDPEKLLTIASWNMLNTTSFSGFNTEPALSDKENKQKRYSRMVDGLITSINLHNVDVIFLQEVNENLAEELLKNKLNNWDIIKQEGMLIAFNHDKYIVLNEKPDNTAITGASGLISVSLQNKSTQEKIDLHNLWGEYNPEEHMRLEMEYRNLLNHAPIDRITVLMGDTNSRIAPIDSISNNITTGIVPTKFNEDISFQLQAFFDENVQIADFPDGGFYKPANGKIQQITTQSLHPENAQIVQDKRSKFEIAPIDRQLPVLMLDEHYAREQEALHKLLGEEIAFTYQVTCNCFNEKRLRLVFNNKPDETVLNKLKPFREFNQDKSSVEKNLNNGKFILDMKMNYFSLENNLVDYINQRKDEADKNPNWEHRSLAGYMFSKPTAKLKINTAQKLIYATNHPNEDFQFSDEELNALNDSGLSEKLKLFENNMPKQYTKAKLAKEEQAKNTGYAEYISSFIWRK